MQNTNSTATAPTKCGLKLNQNTFKFAIEKALTLKPRVQYLSLHDALVASSTGKSDCYVTFDLFEDGLWVFCSCQNRVDPYDAPKACFHAAAAALDRNLFAVPVPIGAQVEEKRLESLAYDAIQRTEQHQAEQDRFRPKFEIVDENTHEERAQRFNWTNYKRVPNSQLHEGWEV